MFADVIRVNGRGYDSGACGTALSTTRVASDPSPGFAGEGIYRHRYAAILPFWLTV